MIVQALDASRATTGPTMGSGSSAAVARPPRRAAGGRDRPAGPRRQDEMHLVGVRRHRIGQQRLKHEHRVVDAVDRQARLRAGSGDRSPQHRQPGAAARGGDVDVQLAVGAIAHKPAPRSSSEDSSSSLSTANAISTSRPRRRYRRPPSTPPRAGSAPARDPVAEADRRARSRSRDRGPARAGSRPRRARRA